MLAQLVEQRTVNPWAAGSNPVQPAICSSGETGKRGGFKSRFTLSVPRRYRFLYCPNCCTLIIQQSNKIVQEAKVPSFATDSSVRNDIENTLILFRCNIPISRLCSANCGLDSYQSLRAECFIYSCKALVRKFTESVRKSNGRILLKGTNPSANVTISKVSDCS